MGSWQIRLASLTGGAVCPARRAFHLGNISSFRHFRSSRWIGSSQGLKSCLLLPPANRRCQVSPNYPSGCCISQLLTPFTFARRQQGWQLSNLQRYRWNRWAHMRQRTSSHWVEELDFQRRDRLKEWIRWFQSCNENLSIYNQSYSRQENESSFCLLAQSLANKASSNRVWFLCYCFPWKRARLQVQHRGWLWMAARSTCGHWA